MIELPNRFKLDVESKTTNLIPLVVIDNTFYFSTNKVYLENNYEAMLKNIGSITESIDVEKKIFKISSLKIEFFNSDYIDPPNNTPLSVRLFNPSIMNKKLDVYYKSQSAQSLDDCLKVYSGYVKDVRENLHTLEINCEDRTEMILDQKLPIRRTPISDDLPEKRRDVPIPIAYGVLDRAALIYNSLTEIDANKHYVTIADDFPIKSCLKPKVLADKGYCNIAKVPEFFLSIKDRNPSGFDSEIHKAGTIYRGLNKNQYYDNEDENHLGEDNSIIFETQYDATYLDLFDFYPDGSTISGNIVEVEQETGVVFKDGNYSLKWNYADAYVATNGLPEGDSDEGFVVCPLRPHTDIGGLNMTNNFYGSYFMPSSDFEGFPEAQRDGQEWLWDLNNSFYGGENPIFGDLRSLNMISVETIEKFASEGSVLNSMPGADKDLGNVFFKSKMAVTYSCDAKLDFGDYQIYHIGSTNIGTPGYHRPGVNFLIGTTNLGNFLMDYTPTPDYSYTTDENEFVEKEYHHNANSAPYFVDTNDVSKTIVEIGNRTYYEDGSTFSVINTQGKQVEYLKFNALKIYKKAILNNFDQFKLYAEVEGIVDNIYGRYTGEALSASSSTTSATTETPSNSEGSSSGGGGGY